MTEEKPLYDVEEKSGECGSDVEALGIFHPDAYAVAAAEAFPNDPERHSKPAIPCTSYVSGIAMTERVFRLSKARQVMSKEDALVLRGVLHGWRGMDEVTIIAPAGLAEQLLAVLDAFAVLQEEEALAKDTDQAMERLHGLSLRESPIWGQVR